MDPGRYPATMLEPLSAWDAVIFDLDGTLVATDRFWPDAARAGALRAFAQLELDRELPTSEEWMSLVGLPLSEGFDQLFEDLDPSKRAVVLECCVEEEHRLLQEGRAGLLPGVCEALESLHASGKKIGIASNCSQAYLEAMLTGAGLGRWVHESRCLESPGIRNKADMVGELLIEFRTRKAVMVGDRDGDRLAAWANGLPHVHLTRGYASDGERVPAEAILPGMDALLPRLGKRMQSVEKCLGALALGTSGVLGILGAAGAGKGWLADDLARVLEHRGFEVELLDAEPFLNVETLQGPIGSGESHAAGKLEVARACLREQELMSRLEVPRSGWLIVHGALLLQPRLLRALDRILVVEVDLETVIRRAHGGHPVPGCLSGELGADPVEMVQRLWSIERGLLETYPPNSIAHARLDGNNWLGEADFEPAGA